MTSGTLKFEERARDCGQQRGGEDATGIDRRRSERRVAVRPVKMFMSGSGRYTPATSSNISDGGALLRLDRERAVRIGDRVSIAIDWGKAGIVSHESMVEARILRVIPIDCHHQAIAIRYEQATETAMPAAQAA